MTHNTGKDITVLAGDIGGTKTDLAVYSFRSGLRRPLAKEKFPSREYSCLEAIIQKFLSEHDIHIDRAAFGVAGPVISGRAKITNLPWVMQEAALAKTLGVQYVCLLNDITAFANAVAVLAENDLHVINKASPETGGTIAVVAPGTGLGEAFLVWDKTGYLAFASEGGHASFAPAGPEQIGLLEYLANRFDHVSYERVCSGMGLANIYAYFKNTGITGEPDCPAEQVPARQNPVPEIIRGALDKNRPCGLCQKTLEVFVSVLGAEAGNMALKTMATGGVYLGGGIPPRILPLLESGVFWDAFVHKGRMSELMKKIPVYVILHSEAALVGAARHAMTTRCTA
ncbi:MAG: glucokinase [Desulfobacteraceae bacterium]|nr:glucokinase [Desulfobacteraceae bacterium]MCF8095168.1 glucokinase [Desulfobacteraceae bacterium]